MTSSVRQCSVDLDDGHQWVPLHEDGCHYWREGRICTVCERSEYVWRARDFSHLPSQPWAKSECPYCQDMLAFATLPDERVS